jgi:hypothetical protein
MSTLQQKKLRLPTHYYILLEPPDESGDEALYFVSERRRVKIKGHSFREFHQFVLPLLNGRHTLEEIQKSVAYVFAPQDLEQCLALLTQQNLLDDDVKQPALPIASAEAIVPQMNFFHEASTNSEELQRRLLRATVTVIGMGGAGAQTAISLGAARVGSIRCVDSSLISAADTYLSPIFSVAQVGKQRAPAVAERINACAPEVNVAVRTEQMTDESQVRQIVAPALRGILST